MSQDASQPTPPDLPPAIDGGMIGPNYRIVRLLGEGGMGKVYEVQHLHLPRRAAVKVLQPSFAKAGEAFERFQREAEIASRLGSRHVVQVYDFGTLPDGSPYMVMELLEGEDLFTHLQARGGRLPLPEVAKWMAQLVAGVAAAHAQNVIHRDLKPENLFLAREPDGTQILKVVDFGLSKIRGVSRSLTGLNTVGTPAYMSPEQIRSSSKADKRADVYALGVIAFQMITGAIPFEDENVMSLMQKVLHERPPAVRTLRPGLSPELERVLDRALAKDPEARYPSVEALWKDLEPAIRNSGLGLAADQDPTHISRPDAPRAPAATAIMESSPSDATFVPRRKQKRVFGFLALAALVAAAALIWLRAAAPPQPAPIEVAVPPAAPATKAEPASTKPEPAAPPRAPEKRLELLNPPAAVATPGTRPAQPDPKHHPKPARSTSHSHAKPKPAAAPGADLLTI